MRRRQSMITGSALLAVALLLSACGDDEDQNAVDTGDAGPAGTAAQQTEQPDPADEDELEVVNLGSVGGLTDAGIYIGIERGFFAEEGIEVERHRITSAPNLTTALATGELQVAGIAISPGLFNSIREGIDLQIVGDKQSLSEGVSATWFAARPEFGVEGDTAATLENLRGEPIAVSARASSTYKILVDLLELHGFTTDDFEIIELGYGDMAAALENQSIQAAIILEPFLVRIADVGTVVLIDDLTSVLPVEEGGVSLVPLVYSDEFASGSPELAQGFMRAYTRGVRAYNDALVHEGAERQEVIDLIAEYAEVDSSLVEAAQVAGLDPDQYPSLNIDYMEALQEFFVAEGMVTEPVEVSSIVNTSFAEQAVEDLGEYQPPQASDEG